MSEQYAGLLSAKQYRLAQHYLGRLRSASRAYRSGDENTTYGLKLAGQDWPQIQQWQAWTVTHADQQHEAAELSSAYPFEGGELLDLILTPQEHRRWRESALAAARQLEDVQAQVAHLLALGEIYYNLEEYNQCRATLGQTIELAERQGDQYSISRALTTLGFLMRFNTEIDQAREYFNQSLEISRRLRDQPGIAKNLLGLGQVAYAQGDIETARALAQECLHLFRELGDQRNTAYALFSLGSSLLTWTETEPGIRYLNESLALYKRIGDRRGMANTLNWLRQAYAVREEYEIAHRYGEESIQLFRELDAPSSVSSLMGMEGYMWFNQGEIERARTYWIDGLPIIQRTGHRNYLGQSLFFLGLVEAIQGRFAAAREYGEATLDNFVQTGDELSHENGHYLLTYSCIGLNDLPCARSHLLDTLELARANNDRNDLVELTLLFAFLLASTGFAHRGAQFFGCGAAHLDQKGWFAHYVQPQIRERLESALSPEAFAAALERGRSLDFDATVAEIIAELRA